MEMILLLFYALIGASLIFLVLLQHGKGSDIGAAFGSGASNALFGPVGPGSLLARITATLGALFFVLSMVLAWQAKQQLTPPALEESALEEIDVRLPVMPGAAKREGDGTSSP